MATDFDPSRYNVCLMKNSKYNFMSWHIMESVIDYYEFRHNWGFLSDGNVVRRLSGAAPFINVRSRDVVGGAPTQVEINDKQFDCGVGYDLKVCLSEDQWAWSTFIIITPKNVHDDHENVVLGEKLIDEFKLDEEADLNTIWLKIDFC